MFEEKMYTTVPVAAIVGIIISISWSSQSSGTGGFVGFYPRRNIYFINTKFWASWKFSDTGICGICLHFEP
jgi:hypothetical protein